MFWLGCILRGDKLSASRSCSVGDFHRRQRIGGYGNSRSRGVARMGVVAEIDLPQPLISQRAEKNALLAPRRDCHNPHLRNAPTSEIATTPESTTGRSTPQREQGLRLGPQVLSERTKRSITCGLLDMPTNIPGRTTFLVPNADSFANIPLAQKRGRLAQG